MQGTVRTSQTIWLSAEGLDDLPCEWEGDGLDEFPLMLDEPPPGMRRERGHDILPLQFAADEVFSAFDLDRAATVDLADERHPALGDGKCQAPAGIQVRLEREALGEMAEGRPEPITKGSGEAGSVGSAREASAGLLELVVTKEAVAGPPQRPQTGTGVKKDALLPQAVKTFHGSVAAGLSRGDEDEMDPQQEMKSGRVGEGVTVPA